MIGSIALAIAAAGFFGVLGVRKMRAISQESRMRVVFEGGSASGLRRGGLVTFDGVQIGEILSLKLDNPRKVVAEVRVDKNAPIRKDTVAGLEFQGLTGVAVISLIGGESSDPPPPSDRDGVPTLIADLSEIQSMRDTLHSVDRILVGNQSTIKDGLLSFETYTASLASRGDEIDKAIEKAQAAFAGFDSAISRIDNVHPRIPGDLQQEVRRRDRGSAPHAARYQRGRKKGHAQDQPRGPPRRRPAPAASSGTAALALKIERGPNFGSGRGTLCGPSENILKRLRNDSAIAELIYLSQSRRPIAL